MNFPIFHKIHLQDFDKIYLNLQNLLGLLDSQDFLLGHNSNRDNCKPKVWIFVSHSPDLKGDALSKVIMETFSKMSKEEVKNSKGLWIKVIRFRKDMSYESLAKQSPLGKFAVDKLRLLNGHYPNKNPKVGDLIKIVQ